MHDIAYHIYSEGWHVFDSKQSAASLCAADANDHIMLVGPHGRQCCCRHGRGVNECDPLEHKQAGELRSINVAKFEFGSRLAIHRLKFLKFARS